MNVLGSAVLDKSQEGSLTGHRVMDMSPISEQEVPDTFVLVGSHPTSRLDTEDVFEGWLLRTNMFGKTV